MTVQCPRPDQARRRRPSVRELERLDREFAFESQRYTPLPMRDLLWFALHTKQDAAAVCALEWDQIDIDASEIRVRTTSESADSALPPKRFNQNVRNILRARARTERRIFPYAPEEIRQAFTLACSKLNIPNLTFDDLVRTRLPHWMQQHFERAPHIPKSHMSGPRGWLH